ncbi:MAG: RHS repeat-associated core domain-containing protein, partial [Frankia sp.]
NLLERLDVRLRGATSATAFVTGVEYDARGRRQRIGYGNGATTTYTYDPETFRLTHLATVREGGAAVQDQRYVYDPVGNVTTATDGVRPAVFFAGAAVPATARYAYDALYQLIEASGREHVGQTTPNPDVPGPPPLPLPGDSQAMRRYQERYAYDPVGNLLRVVHRATGGAWVRAYEYAEPSQLEPDLVSNRLSRTTAGATTEPYRYDDHGNVTALPHLPSLGWDHEDQLVTVDRGGGGRVHYRYDSAGRRMRKVIERQNGTRQQERIYVGGYEVFRAYGADGKQVDAERQTVQVLDDRERVALIETATVVDGAAVADAVPRIRYQLADPLGSVTVELDETAKIITLEEYYTYGRTSHLAGRSAAETGTKRYRYDGKERDEETGLYYYGARYYASWLGRWLSPDPAGLPDGTNGYRYVKNDPVNTTDPTGMWSMPSWRTLAVVAAVVVVGTVLTVATAGVAGPLVVGAVASIGLTGTAATVATGVAVGAIAGAVGGAAAGAAGEATRQTVNSRALGLGTEEFSGGKIAGAAGKGAIEGAVIGGAVGGAAALATTAIGTAAIGAAGKVAQRVVPAGIRSVAGGAADLAAAGARAFAKGTGLQALGQASEQAGLRAAGAVFSEGSTGAQAVARFAETGSAAKTFATEAKAAPPPAAAPPPPVQPPPGPPPPGSARTAPGAPAVPD